jgi:SAM-dependent methyltransferase
MLSHGRTAESFEQTLARRRAEIRARGDLADVTVEQQLDYLERLVAFPFGRFILQHRGWDGYWTDVIIEHPARGRASGTAPDGRPLTELERQVMDTFPAILATQERARHFAAIIQDHVLSGATLASIPCGLMRDLLARDFSGVTDVRLVGIDIDENSLIQAAQLAEAYGLSAVTTFRQRDAWALDARAEFDLIASNGLNIYERDDARVTELYRRLFEALKPNGVLVTSFLTPPPILDPRSEWNMGAIDLRALRLQQILSKEIVGATFDCFRSPATTKRQLQDAGFSTIELTWDKARTFPTALAHKVP